MNVLLLGSGAREHVFAWKITQSKLLTKLFITPGNGGTSELGENLDVTYNSFEEVKKIILTNNIKLVVIGPEEPLVNGIVDILKSDPNLKNVIIIGPQKKAAQLEGNKEFAKTFMQKNNIPTAKYKAFTKGYIKEAYAFLEQLNPPYVLKANELAKGKGVIITSDLIHAKSKLKEMLWSDSSKIASETVIVEEFLKGNELSITILANGSNYLLLPEAKDYKKIGENNSGLNTGGMGAISPIPNYNHQFLSKIKQQIIDPTLKGLTQSKIDYTGFLYFGVINVNQTPYLLEYNCRMGDPEAQVVLPRIKNDIIELFLALEKKELSSVKLNIDENQFCTVVSVSGGYPQEFEINKNITGIDEVTDSLIFQGGTKYFGKNLTTNGGRVLSATSSATSLKKALEKSYTALKKIHFDYEYYRKDIGAEFLNQQS